MKYNRQQKYNSCSAVKTILLILLICLMVLLGYSYMKIRQKNVSILNSIESQKTQISDLEALSRANKEQLKNLRSNIENQQLNLRKLSESIASHARSVGVERSYVNAKQLHKDMKERYESLNGRVNEIQKAEAAKNDKDRELRATRIEALRIEINKLRDAIADLNNASANSNNRKAAAEGPVKAANEKPMGAGPKRQSVQEEKMRDNRNKSLQQDHARAADN